MQGRKTGHGKKLRQSQKEPASHLYASKSNIYPSLLVFINIDAFVS